MLLNDVLRPPDGPRLLLICAYRSEHIEHSACLEALLEVRDSQKQLDVREIRLEPLGIDDSRALAARLLGDASGTERLAAVVARESAGNPYFLRELALRAVSPAPRDEPTGDLTLDSAIWVRVKGLTDEARRLLEVVCVAGRPLHLPDAYKAAGVRASSQKALVYLRNHHLISSTGPSDGDAVEAYHDRIRKQW